MLKCLYIGYYLFFEEFSMNSSDAKKISEERAANTNAVFNNKIPARVPVTGGLSFYAMAQYAGVDPREAYWDVSLLENATDELCSTIPSDGYLLNRAILNPNKYQALGSISVVMGSNGFMQHPNTHMMEPEDYDEFIKDPYATIVETCVPRVYKSLDFKNDPARAMAAISQSLQISGVANNAYLTLHKKMTEKYGYPQPAAGGNNGYAPLDIMTDQLRSFSGMSIDIRRDKGKVKAALDAVYPLNYKKIIPQDLSKYTRNATVRYPLHMATFMREKDFKELWWSYWHRQITDYASLGVRAEAFLEDDWTRYIDYLQDTPTGTYFTFEYGDTKLFKEKLGNKYILGGGFPLRHLTTCTKSEVIDKTKEWLDIMMPGGQYTFSFDKGALVLADVNIENLRAVMETVVSYGVYDNPGTPTGELFNQDDYKHSEYQKFESRIYRTWEQYLEEFPFTPESAKSTIMAAEDAIFDFYYGLCQ